MQTNNTFPSTVYTVITYQIFGQIETVDTFFSKEDAEANVVEWANKNAPDMEKYETFNEAMDYFADSCDENMEITIRLFETTIIGSEVVPGELKPVDVTKNMYEVEVTFDGGNFTTMKMEGKNRALAIAEVLRRMDRNDIKEGSAKLSNDEVFQAPVDFGKMRIEPAVEMRPRYAIVMHADDDGSETLEDYINEETAIEAFEAIRKNGYHIPENECGNLDEKITFEHYGRVKFTMDVELWDNYNNHHGFGVIEHTRIIMINGEVQND